MSSRVTIVGQGLAGTMLAWELERNGADFRIVDARGAFGPRGVAASSVAAGIVNPVTGQRIVKSWRVDELLPLARATFRALEAAWGISVWREMRVRRLWRDTDEAKMFAAKAARGELAPYAGAADGDGFWIEGAAYVDVTKLLQVARERWRASGRLIEYAWGETELFATSGLTVWCTGAELRHEKALSFVPWSIAKGEILTVGAIVSETNVILNRGHWFLPVGSDRGKVGATYLPRADDTTPSEAAQVALRKSASELLPGPFEILEHEAGLRLTLPDKHPIVGRLPHDNQRGVLGGLGSKGVLLAPWLARQWWNHLSEGVPFDPLVDVARFWSAQENAL